MPRLPRATDAVVDEIKVRDYLLSAEHPVGRSKARFFESLGYRRESWNRLRLDLLELAHHGEAIPGIPGPYGLKYEVRATLSGPTSRWARIVTVWIVLEGEEIPRFVTAYPG